MHIGRAIFDALPASDQHWRCLGVAYSAADVLDADGGASIPFDLDTG